MAKRKRSQQQGELEWIGRLVSAPVHVVDAGEPHRPDALDRPYWRRLGWTIAKPGQLLAPASRSLQNAIEPPCELSRMR